MRRELRDEVSGPFGGAGRRREKLSQPRRPRYFCSGKFCTRSPDDLASSASLSPRFPPGGPRERQSGASNALANVLAFIFVRSWQPPFFLLPLENYLRTDIPPAVVRGSSTPASSGRRTESPSHDRLPPIPRLLARQGRYTGQIKFHLPIKLDDPR